MAQVLAQPEWDEDKPALSWALSISDAVLELHREDDGRDKKHIKRARYLFRDALSRGAEPRIVLVWYFMEMGHRDTAGARACFEEWQRSHGCGGGGAGDADLRCNYALFECQYGTRARTRAVAEAAVAACPRDPKVFAMYACVELRMGRDRRARDIVRRAHDVFAEDEDTVKWIENDVDWHRMYLRDGRRTIGDIFRGLFFNHCGRGAGSAY